MRTKILMIVCSILLVFCPGCQRKDKEVPEENNLPQEEQQQEINLEVLEAEYSAIMTLIQDVLFSVTDEELDARTAIELFKQIRNAKIDATQPQTIELNKKLDELLDLGVNYFVTINEERRELIRNDITKVLNEMEEIMLEIEELLIQYNEA